MQLWLDTLSTVPAVVMVKVAFFYAKRRVAFSAACSRTGFALPLTTIEGYREGMSAPLLVLPESGGRG